MSNTQQTKLTPEQEAQQLFSKLSIEFKTPLRNILGEAEEAVYNTISNMINQLIQINTALKNSNQEITRLQKLCTDNDISFIPKSSNRKEHRIDEKKQAKK